MNKPLFTGVCTAMVTPFLDGKVNYPMMEILLQRQIDAGIPAAVICGTTGESSTLHDEEKLELFRRCKKFVGDTLLIIAGTGSNSTAHTIDLSIAAQECGVDGLLVVSPYYNKATEDGLVAHYASVAHNVQIPIILYNVPSRTGQDMSTAVYKRLAGIGNIAGVKEASTQISKVTKIRSACGTSLPIWAGNDDLTVPAMALGASGVISVASNLIPAQMQEMALAALDGDFDTAAALQCELSALTELLCSEVNPIPIKAAMRLTGFDCGICRLPLTKLSTDNERKLRQLLKT